MNDKEIMEGILLTAKGVCDLVYAAMANHGWYPSDVAPAQQRQQVKNKFANSCC